MVRDQEVPSSNLGAPTIPFNNFRMSETSRKLFCDVVCDVTPLRLPCFYCCQRFDSQPFSRKPRVRIDSHHLRVNVARQFTDYGFRHAGLAEFGYKLVAKVVKAEARISQ